MHAESPLVSFTKFTIIRCFVKYHQYFHIFIIICNPACGVKIKDYHRFVCQNSQKHHQLAWIEIP